LTVPIHIDRDDPKFSLIDKNYLLDAAKEIEAFQNLR
jgi:hypothetical protein